MRYPPVSVHLVLVFEGGLSLKLELLEGFACQSFASICHWCLRVEAAFNS